MIERFRLANFKGHVDTSLELGRLTVLVGDNGSGKTSVLEALQLYDWLSNGREAAVDPLLLRHGETQLKLGANGHDLVLRRGATWFETPLGQRWPTQTPATARARIYQFNANSIAAAFYSDDVATRVAPDGLGTPVVLGALKLERDRAFDKIQTVLKRLVPSMTEVNVVRSKIRRYSPTHPGELEDIVGNRLAYNFTGADGIGARQTSQGTLILTALLTMLFEDGRPNLILLDDIEQALHPRAQMELVKVLRELLDQPEFAEVQIVATTHSPFVLDMVEPKDVYAFALDAGGLVHSKRLSEHPEAAALGTKITSGGLWTLDPERYWVLPKAA